MPRRGSLHHLSKLTEEDVRKIREAYATGTTSHFKLAAEYDLHPATVGCIVTRKTWTHI